MKNPPPNKNKIGYSFIRSGVLTSHKIGKENKIKKNKNFNIALFNNRKFELIDAKIIHDGSRNVFRFFLRPAQNEFKNVPFLKQTRIIPTRVKVEVWKRDHGCCVLCGSKENLHFDHDIPYSKGGSSITAKNVRLLCAKHNLSKSDKIMGFAPWITTISTLIITRTA